LKGQALARLRVFAGSNGSDKSTIRKLLGEKWGGVYVNADEIKNVLPRKRAIDLADRAAKLQWRLRNLLKARR
jgi:predicted ABC-type ATPase